MPAPATPPAPRGGAKSPAVIASIGIISGPVGATTAPIMQGVQLWAKYVNQQGGLNGHPVKLLAYDDGGDPSRAKAYYKDAIEGQGAIALVSIIGGVAGTPVDYINAKHVPVIGSEGATPGFYESPYYFPQQSSRDAMFFTWIAGLAEQAISRNKTKLGLVYCTESETGCGVAARMAKSNAKELGMNLVYETRVSLAQPDFTAECLAARNAGADVVMLVVDGNSIGRFSSSCARQGYKPLYGTGSGIVLNRFKDDPNLDGFIAVTVTFPWFQTSNTGPAEYARVIGSLGSNVTPGAAAPTGWTAGKLLEKAAANLPEPPTADAVLRGLWSIKNDDLGGLTLPLTFEEARPAVPRACWFNITAKSGTWVSPDDFKLRCRDFKP